MCLRMRRPALSSVIVDGVTYKDEQAHGHDAHSDLREDKLDVSGFDDPDIPCTPAVHLDHSV